jgi:hypothetical protein
LNGPVFRPELRIPLADGAIVLRFAPELFVIVDMTQQLRDLGSIMGGGLALGAEVACEIRLHPLALLAVSYRESRAATATAWSATMTDTERFVIAHAGLRY